MLLGSEISTIYFSSQDDVLVQSSHGWLIEDGNKSGFGIFVFYPSVRGLCSNSQVNSRAGLLPW